MMVADAVSGALRGEHGAVKLALTARLVGSDGVTVKNLDLVEGDGMCMGFHGWLEGEFGRDPVVDQFAS